jgi:hypothetical protein
LSERACCLKSSICMRICVHTAIITPTGHCGLAFWLDLFIHEQEHVEPKPVLVACSPASNGIYQAQISTLVGRKAANSPQNHLDSPPDLFRRLLRARHWVMGACSRDMRRCTRPLDAPALSQQSKTFQMLLDSSRCRIHRRNKLEIFADACCFRSHMGSNFRPVLDGTISKCKKYIPCRVKLAHKAGEARSSSYQFLEFRISFTVQRIGALAHIIP